MRPCKTTPNATCVFVCICVRVRARAQEIILIFGLIFVLLLFGYLNTYVDDQLFDCYQCF